MALTGSMRDFGISEILQLIGTQKKSGTLTVRDKTRKVEILFDQGNIVGASHEPVQDFFDLGSILHRGGILPKDEVESIRREQAESLQPFEQVILKRQSLGLPQLKEIIKLSYLEIIYSLFLWKDGRYSFEAGSVTYTQQWTSPISSEQVLMDGYRIKDEWPLVARIIPKTNSILEKVEGEDLASVSRDQEKVLKLVDGNRTAEDIIFLTRMGSFETLKTIRDLIEKNRVTVAGAVMAEEARDLTAVILQAAAAVVAAVGILLALFGGLALFDEPAPSEPGVETLRAIEAMHKKDLVKSALTQYALMNGKYPADLSELAASGLMDDEDMNTPKGRFEYTVLDGGASCRLEAPDGTAEEMSGTEEAEKDQGS